MKADSRTILDLCGGTGAWSRPYAKAGYNVQIVTLPDSDVRTFTPPRRVHGILAAPPCEQFSIAKGSLPREFDKGMEVVTACLRIIWWCRIHSGLQWWALENPRGFLRQFLGKPHATVRYWQYGDGLDKPTDLWGYYDLPKARYTQPPGLIKLMRSTTNDKELRSTTPPCFAEAFFKANP